MTLHEAIEKVLKKKGRQMTIIEIANELNINKWYQKKNGSEILPLQIHGRTRNYSNLFDRNGSIVSLTSKLKSKDVTQKKIETNRKPKLTKISIDATLLEKGLMNENNFKDASLIDNLIPNLPGLYCIKIKNRNRLPEPFRKLLRERNHNIIYIGIASQNLKKRFLNQELRAKGNGTFFRSIGAVLGFRPKKSSLLNKRNKRNYRFELKDENEIINWINKNLKVNWLTYHRNFKTVETGLIQKYLPLLNIINNPVASTELLKLRAECVKIANS